MKRFLIVGCPRSGTKYIATLMSEIGVPCNWERIYHVDNEEFEWPEEPVGEASWYAVPRLDNVPDDTIIFHQTRNPVVVVSSMKRWGLLNSRKKDFNNGFSLIDEKIGDSGKKDTHSYFDAWMRVNAKIEPYAFYRYKIEDIDTEIFKILKLIEFDVDQSTVIAALEKVSKKTNSNGEHTEYEIPDLCEAIREMIERYGY